MGDLKRYEIRGKLDNINLDKYQPFTPQTRLSVDEYEDTVNNSGMTVTKGDFTRLARPINSTLTGEDMFNFVVQKGKIFIQKCLPVLTKYR